MVPKLEATQSKERSRFLLIVVYRWLSLIPAVASLSPWYPQPAEPGITLFALALALAANILLTLFYARLNRLALRWPLLLSADLVFSASLIAVSGGWQSPYYLYALSTLMASALLFQFRGALLAAFLFSVLYLLALFADLRVFGGNLHLPTTLTLLVGVFVIAGAFGYVGRLLQGLQQNVALLTSTHEELLARDATLERTVRELQSIHSLTMTMQSSAVDLGDVQERILRSVTEVLGFERAILAVIDQDQDVLSGWLIHHPLIHHHNGAHTHHGLSHTTQILIRPESGLIAQAILDGQVRYIDDGSPPTTDPQINERLRLSNYAILPLTTWEYPSGLLLVDNPNSRSPISTEGMASLKALVNQAALVLGRTQLCINRARHMAVEEERSRIALEMHDTITQSLFGIVYTLDGCIKLLPNEVELVKEKLTYLHTLTLNSTAEIRRSIFDIWSADLNREHFQAKLRGRLQELGAPKSLKADIQVIGEFDKLDRVRRRHLLRVAEEALANTIKHAEATEVSVQLGIDDGHARLVVADNGRGFDTSRSEDGDGNLLHLGLHGMKERATYLGGYLCVTSRPNRGTEVIAVVPCEG